MSDTNPFTITVGNILKWELTFWETDKGYMYRSVGIGEPTRCSKETYDKALELYRRKNQHGRCN